MKKMDVTDKQQAYERTKASWAVDNLHPNSKTNHICEEYTKGLISIDEALEKTLEFFKQENIIK